ncbi:CAP domain-containing protein [Microbacteriaceae bacterium 4G12]
MKTLLRVLFFTVLILFVDLYGSLLMSQYTSHKSNDGKKIIVSKPKHKIEETSANAVSNLLGSSSENVLALLGEPARIEPSGYDYDWWIYNQNLDKYIQLGIVDNKVVTIYVGGDQVDIAPFYMGQKYKDIYALYPFSYEVTLENKESSYQFELSEAEVTEQPLISLRGGWGQLYFDKFTHNLVGIRYMDDETLLKQRPYQLVYSGQLVVPKVLTEEQERKVEAANAKQILDLTNLIRQRHGLSKLTWEEPAAQVAYSHSKDMKDENYFAHESPKFGTLSDRLTKDNVPFRLAGENIASNYTDAIAAVQGWLNSEGHRKNLLNKQFTSLGVGVYDKYYTQNFIQK